MPTWYTHLYMSKIFQPIKIDVIKIEIELKSKFIASFSTGHMNEQLLVDIKIFFFREGLKTLLQCVCVCVCVCVCACACVFVHYGY